jgi:hypothetical protein
VIEKWETLNPEGTKTHFEFELTRKSGKYSLRNGTNGMSDIEGKAARVAAME